MKNFLLLFFFSLIVLQTFSQQNTTYVCDSIGASCHKCNELLVWFHPSVVETSQVDSMHLQNWNMHQILKKGFTDQIPANIRLDLERAIFYRVFGIHTTDTISISRLGTEVRIPPFWSVFRIVLISNVNTQYQIAASLKNLFPNVISAEQNYVFFPTTDITNDDYISEFDNRQLSLHDYSYNTININIEEAWQFEKGKSFIKVGIIDSGINCLHEDFQFSSTENVVNTGEGICFDHRTGGHGTQVAGIIGAVSNNNKGIAGIAGGDALLAQKGVELIDFCQYYEPWSNDGISAAIILGSMSNNLGGYECHLLNLSLATNLHVSSIDYSEFTILKEAIEFANKNHVTVVVSRGNFTSPQATFSMPACLRNDWILNIAAHKHNGLITSNSLFGFGMDILAPGPQLNNNYVYTTSPSGYGTFSHTSCAAPHTSGSAALVLSYINDPMPDFNNLTHEDVEKIIELSTHEMYVDRDYWKYNNFEEEGYGRLNAGNALKMLEKSKYQIFHFSENNVSFTLNNPSPVQIKLRYPFFKTGYNPLNADMLYTANMFEFYQQITSVLPQDYYIDTCWAISGFSSFWGQPDSDGYVWHDTLIVECDNQDIIIKGYVYQIGSNFYPALSDLNFGYSLYTYHSLTAQEEFHNNEFNILGPYPSPSDGNFSIELYSNEFIYTSIGIYNIQGQKLFDLYEGNVEQNIKNDFTFFVDIPNGIYFIKICNSNKTYFKKFIILK